MKITCDKKVITFLSNSTSLSLAKLGFYTMHDDQQIARLFLPNKSLQKDIQSKALEKSKAVTVR